MSTRYEKKFLLIAGISRHLGLVNYFSKPNVAKKMTVCTKLMDPSQWLKNVFPKEDYFKYCRCKEQKRSKFEFFRNFCTKILISSYSKRNRLAGIKLFALMILSCSFGYPACQKILNVRFWTFHLGC